MTKSIECNIEGREGKGREGREAKGSEGKGREGKVVSSYALSSDLRWVSS